MIRPLVQCILLFLEVLVDVIGSLDAFLFVVDDPLGDLCGEHAAMKVPCDQSGAGREGSTVARLSFRNASHVVADAILVRCELDIAAHERSAEHARQLQRVRDLSWRQARPGAHAGRRYYEMVLRFFEREMAAGNRPR